MRRPTVHEVLVCVGLIALFCMLMQGWGSITAFIGIVLTACIPLALGFCIAYVIAIPTRFLERHFLPNSESSVVAGLRRPVALALVVLLALAILVLSTSMLIPALIETVTMVQHNWKLFIEDLIQLPALEPVRATVQDFLDGDFAREIQNTNIPDLIKNVLGGTVGNVTTQVFTMVSMVMTGFFGLMFSFVLLTDTTDVGHKVMRALSNYLGPERTERVALVMGVTDASFHNFIVRQCIEALILGSVGTTVLLALRFDYALGVGVLMFMAALVPIVGYPVGLFAGAFMVAINNVWWALIYLVVVALAQVLEATFVLPHVGDPQTALPPVWVTVGVTIGGGVAGFVGMLVAIPIASTIRQLIIINLKRRDHRREVQAATNDRA